MLDIHDLLIVRAIAEHGSLARAARVLGTGQPALTRGLAALEARLQGPLFERDRRGAVLTDIGRVVLAGSAEILARLDDLNRHVVVVRGDQTKDLVIAAGSWAGESIGAVAAARMFSPHPTIRLRLMTANWANVPTLVREREAVLGLLDLSDLGDAPDLVVEALSPQPAFFVVRPGHPLLALERPSLADIMAWPMAFLARAMRRAQVPMAAAREAARAAGSAHPAFPALVMENLAMGLTVVRHSDAVAPTNAPAAAAALRAGEVVALRWHEPWAFTQWGIIRRRGHQPSEAEEAFLDLLRGADREAGMLARQVMAEAGLSWTMPGAI